MVSNTPFVTDVAVLKENIAILKEKEISGTLSVGGIEIESDPSV
jgi:hypothetical protein